ncbi:MAG: hypothetical protein MI674_04575, partial [Cytophagales bacterium]|nr:hypothetical protein [Cytophagales bacterium]
PIELSRFQNDEKFLYYKKINAYVTKTIAIVALQSYSYSYAKAWKIHRSLLAGTMASPDFIAQSAGYIVSIASHPC